MYFGFAKLNIQMMKSARDLFTSLDSFHTITVGAYQIMGRLQDVQLTNEFTHSNPQICAPFNDLFGLAYQSGSIGYCFADPKDHMSTTAIPDVETRQKLADQGEKLIGVPDGYSPCSGSGAESGNL